MKRFIKSAIACLAAVAMVVTAVPANVNAAPKKTVVVTSQKALEKAIKQGATKITIKTKKNVAITIPSGKKLNGVSIVVNAKNASVTNKGSVKSLTIKDALSFTEKGKNNTIKVTDTQLTLKVANAAKGTEISVAKKNADVTLVVSKKAEVAAVEVAAEGVSLALDAKGSVAAVTVAENATDAKLNIDAAGVVESVTVDAKADVEVKGSTTETVKVVVNAADTVVKAETAVDTTLNADAKVDLSAGAEGSKVTTAENVTSDITNGTSEQIKVTDSKGTETSVDAGKSESKTDSKTDTSKDTSTSGGSTSGGSTTPTKKTWVVTSAALLKEALSSAKDGETIEIRDDIKPETEENNDSDRSSQYANYDVTCGAITIKGTENKTVYGTFTIMCEGVTLDGLTIANRGGGSDKQKNAVNVVADKFTMQNCTVKLAQGLSDGVANGLCLYPLNTTTNYTLSGNTFEGYNATATGDSITWTSSAIMITEGYNLKDRFGVNKKTPTNVVIAENDNEEAIAMAQTYENVCIAYVHNDYSAGSGKLTKYIFCYRFDDDVSAYKYRAAHDRTNKALILETTNGKTYTLKGDTVSGSATKFKDYTTSTALKFNKGSFVVSGCAVTCGALVIGDTAQVEVSTGSSISCTSCNVNASKFTGGGTVIVKGTTVYDKGAVVNDKETEEAEADTEEAKIEGEESSSENTQTTNSESGTTENS